MTDLPPAVPAPIVDPEIVALRKRLVELQAENTHLRQAARQALEIAFNSLGTPVQR